MSKQPDCEPHFSRSRTLELLNGLVKGVVNDPAFESKWQAIVSEFGTWDSGSDGQNTSRLNDQLEFLRRICAAFPNSHLNNEPMIVGLLLSRSGLKNIGDTFRGPLPNGKAALLKVIRREITDRFGVLYTLETQEGFQFTREFFD